MSTKNALHATSPGSSLPEAQQTHLVQTYLPKNYLPQVRKMTTPEQVLAAKDICTGLLARQLSHTKIEALIKLYVVRLNELLDLKRPLSEVAIDEIAATLMTGPYRNLSLTDIAFVLQQATRGMYGELYESLNVTKVLRWFDAYWEERVAAAERISERERNRHNSLFGRERSSEQDGKAEEFHAYQVARKARLTSSSSPPER